GLSTRGREVELLDSPAEEEVVDDRVDETDRDDEEDLPDAPGQARSLRQVEHVVEEAGGEPKARLNPEEVDEGERRTGENRVRRIQRGSNVCEGELKRLSDAGKEGGERQ